MEIPERVVERLNSRRVESSDGCWLWTRGTNGVGYGRISWKDAESGRQVWMLTHRLAYLVAHGSIPDGVDIDHLCHDPDRCSGTGDDCLHRRCINPDHLGTATRRENLLRGGGIASSRASVRECPKGHAYTTENTIYDKLGRRSCRECVRIKNRAYYWKNRERRSAYNKAWRDSRRTS